MARLSGKGGSMSTLRTLKDIETLDMKERAFANSIRQEAIRDIKELRRCNDGDIPYVAAINDLHIEFNDEYYIEETIIDYIKWKNNITEEDLK